ncbi:amidohydrolase family protein [Pseudonocardia sp. CA-142604]|uniref:amidohydrolase family protein n=1 Tax=Pseudonocardia sp. CA-142604 TaxID=3240024 RepID=UPI003D90808B
MTVIDAHLHLWDLQRSAYEWITPELGPLHTTVTAERAHAELRGAGVDRAVLVQAEDSEVDTEFMLEVAAAHSWVAGVVGWLKLDDPAAAERQLDRWSADPAFVGVRHLVHDDPRDDFLALPTVRASLSLLAARGLPFDVPDAWPRHLAATAELAAALPELTVVLDHLGKPPHGRPEFAEWRSVLADVAARPNTVAKVSGLQVRGMPFTADVLRPAWDAALELFGPDRLIWGSDWPMTLLTAGYAGTWEVLSALVGELTPDEQQAVLAGTACRVYRLGSVLTKQPTTPEAPC